MINILQMHGGFKQSTLSTKLDGILLVGHTTKNIPIVSNLAAKFVSAEVDPNEWDERWYVNVGTVIVGVLGL